MTVQLCAAQPSQLRISLSAVRSCFLWMLLAAFGGLAFGQGLSPGSGHAFGPVDLGGSGSYDFPLQGPAGGSVTIGTITVVTEGAPTKDFNLVPTANECSGTVYDTSSCSIEVSFTPTQIGLRFGALIITNTSGAVVNTIYLSGVGVGPQFVFSPAKAITTSTASALTGPSTFTAGSAVRDGNDNLFFTDVANNRILERSSTGAFTEVTPLTVTPTSGITIDGAGNLYVSSGKDVYTIPYGTTTATPISTGGTLTAPAGLTVDSSGNLYIADSGTGTIYQLPLGTSTAFPLTLTGPDKSLDGPTGLAVDVNNNLYVADTKNNRIVEVSLGNAGTALGATSLVNFNPAPVSPTGIAVDAASTVYVANTGAGDVIELTASGHQFSLDDPGLTLEAPAGIVINANGDLVIADTDLGLVYIERSSSLIKFPTPTVVGTLDTTDDPQTLTVQGTGNIVSSLTASSTNPSISTDAFLLGTAPNTPCPVLSSGAFTIGQVCTYAINFQPTVVGPNRADLVLTTSAAGGAMTSTSTARLFGIGLSTITSFNLVATPSVTNINTPVELVLTAVQSNGATATDYIGTVTFTSSNSAAGKYLGGTAPNTSTTTYTFTAADNGVLTIPASSGLEFSQYGTYTARVTGSECPPAANCTATSNNIYVVEPDTLTLTSSINPSQINQSTAFTLHVATTGPTPPGGTVTFYSDGTQIGSPVTLGANGSASINDSFPANGTYAITATYKSSTYTQDGTASLNQIVGNATAMTLTSSVNPSFVNQSTTLSVNITAPSTPTGTVTFYNGTTPIQSVPVSGTSVSISTSFATVGTYPLKAVFSTTNPGITGATSNTLQQVVENSAQLTLTSSVNPSQINQSTTLTATLTALGTPAGSVTFYDGATPIGTATLVGTTASISSSFSTSGTHTLKAVYTSSSTSTENATSAPLLQAVLNATTITLASSVNPSQANQSTTLTAVVKSSGTPTGTVTFKSNGTTLGTGTLSGGMATLAVSFPTPGTYTLTAVYGGDSNNQTMTSAPLTQTVLNAATIALTSSINPVFLDNPTILTAMLTSTGANPTGTVSFFDGNTPIGSGTLVNGAISISAAFVYAGTHTITAKYTGDASTGPVNSPALSQTVADFSLTVASGGSNTASTIAGGTTAYSLALTPIITATLPSAVSLTVTGLPTSVTGVLTPTSIAAGSGATPVSLSVTAAYLIAALHNQQPPAHRSSARYAPVALALLALPLAWFRRRKRFGSLFASACLLLVFATGLTGCVSNPTTGYYGQSPKTYNLTVTATSGNLVRSTYLTLTVQ